MRRDPYVTRILLRLLAERPELTQYDLASALDCDRSRIAHQVRGTQVRGTQAITVDELAVWCSVLGTTEPLAAIARRCGMRLVPLDEPAEPAALERAGARLLSAAGRLGAELGDALEDGRLDEAELAALRRTVGEVERVLGGLKARLGGS